MVNYSYTCCLPRSFPRPNEGSQYSRQPFVLTEWLYTFHAEILHSGISDLGKLSFGWLLVFGLKSISVDNQMKLVYKHKIFFDNRLYVLVTLLLDTFFICPQRKAFHSKGALLNFQIFLITRQISFLSNLMLSSLQNTWLLQKSSVRPNGDPQFLWAWAKKRNRISLHLQVQKIEGASQDRESILPNFFSSEPKNFFVFCY